MKRSWQTLFGLLIFSVFGATLAQEDPPPAPWAEEAVQVLVAKGIFIGYPDGSFHWKNPLTREEAALALYRLLAAYGLDGLSPEEVGRIKEAVDRLLGEQPKLLKALEELRKEVEALKGKPEGEVMERLRALEERLRQAPSPQAPLEDRLARLEESIRRLEEGLKGLSAAQAALEARALQDRLQALEERSRKTEEALRSAEARTQALANQLEALKQEIQALKGATSQLETQTQALAEALKPLPETQKLLQEARSRLDALEGRLGGLEDRLHSLEDRLARLEARTDTLEKNQADGSRRLGQVEAQLNALRGELQELQRTFSPQRNPLYLAFGLYLGDVDRRPYGRLSLGHDALYGPLGARLLYEGGLQNPAEDGLLGGDLTFRMSIGAIDGYFGVGTGAYLKGQVGFGQLVVGASLHLFPSLALFLEGDQRYLFDGQMGQRSLLLTGLQLRF